MSKVKCNLASLVEMTLFTFDGYEEPFVFAASQRVFLKKPVNTGTRPKIDKP